MALFKVFKGNNASNLNGLEKHDGYSYYDTNATRFYIDAFYPPTTAQSDIIVNYLNEHPDINKTGTTAINYFETVDSSPIEKTMIISFISDKDYLVLDRRPINKDSIVNTSVIGVNRSEVNPKTGQNEIVRYGRALKLEHADGTITYAQLASSVPNSTTNAIAFFRDADGGLSTTNAPYTGGDPKFVVDPENGILTSPKFNGYIVAGHAS